MSNKIIRATLKHKQLVALSVVAIALAAYIFPIDSLFTHQATAARGSSSGNGPYGHFGPAPGHGGQNPGHGGSPPGNTPGGSNTPPGQQRGD
jgi:hypothetical protein